MILKFLMAFTIFALPISIKPVNGLITITSRPDKEIANCIANGVRARIKSEIKLCKSEGFWSDDCNNSVFTNGIVNFDPIIGNYTVSRDILGDKVPPAEATFSKIEDVISAFFVSLPISPQTLKKQMSDTTSIGKGSFLKVRTIAYCKSNYNKTLDRITALLTLGIFRLPRYDSGWVTISPR